MRTKAEICNAFTCRDIGALPRHTSRRARLPVHRDPRCKLDKTFVPSGNALTCRDIGGKASKLCLGIPSPVVGAFLPINRGLVQARGKNRRQPLGQHLLREQVTLRAGQVPTFTSLRERSRKIIHQVKKGVLTYELGVTPSSAVSAFLPKQRTPVHARGNSTRQPRGHSDSVYYACK